jgi:hypothetical protein
MDRKCVIASSRRQNSAELGDDRFQESSRAHRHSRRIVKVGAGPDAIPRLRIQSKITNRESAVEQRRGLIEAVKQRSAREAVFDKIDRLRKEAGEEMRKMMEEHGR